MSSIARQWREKGTERTGSVASAGADAEALAGGGSGDGDGGLLSGGGVHFGERRVEAPGKQEAHFGRNIVRLLHHLHHVQRALLSRVLRRLLDHHKRPACNACIPDICQ